jgi:hypothetical protein
VQSSQIVAHRRRCDRRPETRDLTGTDHTAPGPAFPSHEDHRHAFRWPTNWILLQSAKVASFAGYCCSRKSAITFCRRRWVASES